MIDLRKYNDKELKDFEDKASRGFYEPGTAFLYHEGNFGDEVGKTKLGAMMQRLVGYTVHNETKPIKFNPRQTVRLFQRKIQADHLIYYAVTK